MLHAVLAHIGELHGQLTGAVAWQRGAIRGDGEEHTAPAVHTGLGAFFVVVRGDKNQLARIAGSLEFVAVFIGDAFGSLQLRARWQQADAVEMGPAIELTGGQFYEVSLQGDAQLDDAVDFVDVVPVGDKIQHHRITVGFDRAGHFKLLCEGFFRTGQQVVDLLIAGLKAYLDMVQAGFFECGNLLFGEANAGSDQVGVVTQAPTFSDQLGQILAHQRFATGKAQLRCAHFPRLGHDLEPLLGAQLLALGGEIQRVGAVRAL
ncbi:hypothetical protein D3C79_719210 [compost metagenome]